jgi:hypothetical protein
MVGGQPKPLGEMNELVKDKSTRKPTTSHLLIDRGEGINDECQTSSIYSHF